MEKLVVFRDEELFKDSVVANYAITASVRKVYQDKGATCMDFLQVQIEGIRSGTGKFCIAICTIKCIAKCNVLL